MENNKKIIKNEFKNGHINHYKVGEKAVCSNNMIAEIIEYRNHKDIDVRYEDGDILSSIQRIKVFFKIIVLDLIRNL